jgi:mono/diheme cytochrome c family protein
MKKTCVLFLIILAASVFQFCSTSKKASKEPEKITYVGHVQSIVQANCAPCHFPPKGNKKPMDTYAAVKEDIDDIILRIQKNPDERGFMPMRHPKLPDSTINVFVQWQKDGLLEK